MVSCDRWLRRVRRSRAAGEVAIRVVVANYEGGIGIAQV